MELEDIRFAKKLPKDIQIILRQSAENDDSEHPPARFDSKGNRIYGNYTILKRQPNDNETESVK